MPRNETVHLSTKHIKHHDAVAQRNEQLSSLFSVAQTPRRLVVKQPDDRQKRYKTSICIAHTMYCTPLMRSRHWTEPPGRSAHSPQPANTGWAQWPDHRHSSSYVCNNGCIKVEVFFSNFARLCLYNDSMSQSPRKRLISLITLLSATLKILFTALLIRLFSIVNADLLGSARVKLADKMI